MRTHSHCYWEHVKHFKCLFSALGSLAQFSMDSGESSNQEDDYESEAGESEEPNTEEFMYMDEQLERRSNPGGEQGNLIALYG